MNEKKIYLAIAVVALAIFTIGIAASKTSDTVFGGIGSTFASVNFPSAIGTATSPSTLTTAYNGASSTRLAIDGMPKIAIAGSYTPKSYGSRAFLLVERSVDDGATFKPYVTLTPESADVLVNTSGSSTTEGSPFLIPGNALYTAASGTAIGFSFDLDMTADFIRVRAKESTTSTAGTLNVQIKAASN